MARGILIFNNKVIKEYPFTKEGMTIGRNEGNDIAIDNLAVSGLHARIDKTENTYILTDLQSTKISSGVPAFHHPVDLRILKRH